MTPTAAKKITSSTSTAFQVDADPRRADARATSPR
jgi:hypothetical protein